MITPKEKIKVFISSACGKEQWKQKYNGSMNLDTKIEKLNGMM